MDLVTLPRVKLRVGISNTDDDTQLATMISGVSEAMCSLLDRHELQTERTEVYEVRANQRYLHLRGWPVLSGSMFSVKPSLTRSFASATVLTKDADYTIDYDCGVLRFYTSFDVSRSTAGRMVNPSFVQVVYTGGLAASAAAVESAYPALAQAAEDQVAYLWKRKDSQGGNVTVGQSSTQYQREYDLLPAVRETVARMRREVY